MIEISPDLYPIYSELAVCRLSCAQCIHKTVAIGERSPLLCSSPKLFAAPFPHISLAFLNTSSHLKMFPIFLIPPLQMDN